MRACRWGVQSRAVRAEPCGPGRRGVRNRAGRAAGRSLYEPCHEGRSQGQREAEPYWACGVVSAAGAVPGEVGPFEPGRMRVCGPGLWGSRASVGAGRAGPFLV